MLKCDNDGMLCDKLQSKEPINKMKIKLYL